MFMRAMKLSVGHEFRTSVRCWIFSVASALVLMTGSSAGAQEVAAEPDKDKPTVVCFGDSITNRGYYKTLAETLNVNAINAGVAGHTTAKGLRRMQRDVLDRKPGVVVIFFGTNDLRADAEKVYVPVDKYSKNLETMIKACAKIDAGIVLCTVPPINQTVYFEGRESEAHDAYEALGGLEKMLQSYRVAAQEVAVKHSVPIVDLNAILPEEPDWLSKDGVHPSKKGCRILAKHIAKAVAPLLPEKVAKPAVQEKAMEESQKTEGQ